MFLRPVFFNDNPYLDTMQHPMDMQSIAKGSAKLVKRITESIRIALFNIYQPINSPLKIKSILSP